MRRESLNLVIAVCALTVAVVAVAALFLAWQWYGDYALAMSCRD